MRASQRTTRIAKIPLPSLHFLIIPSNDKSKLFSYLFVFFLGFMNSDADLDFIFALHIIDVCAEGRGQQGKGRGVTTAAP